MINDLQSPRTIPDQIVYAKDGLRFLGAVIGQQRGFSLQPEIATMLTQKSIVAGLHLSLAEHWRNEEEKMDWSAFRKMIDISNRFELSIWLMYANGHREKNTHAFGKN